MKLTILGCHSATPRVGYNTTSQVLEIKNHMFLIDCGEGAQVELRRCKIKFSKIKHIFISHLHGDHVFGLSGLVSTFNLHNRKDDLNIYAPKGLKEVITLQMKLAESWTSYNIIFHELTSLSSEVILEDETVEVRTIPLKHRVYTNGFLFKEKLGQRKLDIEKVEEADIDVAYYRRLKLGRDVKNRQDQIIKNETVTYPPLAPKSYAFCSDTVYNDEIVPTIKNVSCLYHESTFLSQNDKLAAITKHSTAKHAAQIAKMANVGMLILGHYSTRYDNFELFKEEAETTFGNVILAKDGLQINID
ncbi:MAG: ribonuclease Z [Bacteroidota bacterium]